ncbi:aconitase/3-isopropylmalate dehydratase large subunit family protein [Chloroflexota bacterium]
MGETLVQKILAKKSGKKKVIPGEVIWVQPDLIAQYSITYFSGGSTLPDVRINPDRIAISPDHHFMPKGENEAKSHATMREMAKKYNIKNYHDIGQTGIQFQLLAEKGLVRPGMLIVHADSHVSTYGAFGTYAVGVGRDYVQAYRTGEVWLRVPQTLKINVTGKFPEGVTSRDLFEKILADIGPGGAIGQAIQYTGPAVSAMSIESRMVLCNSVVFMSAETAIIEPDQKILEYVKARTTGTFEALKGDASAEYTKVLNYDVSKLEPQVVMPTAVYHVKTIKEAAGIEIDQAFIGTCASGRMEDLRLAARILKGRKIHQGTRLVIAPITPEIQRDAAREGLTDIFWEAGALVGPPSCGMCLQGGYGWLLPGERFISTGTLNLPGRHGSPEAQTYLANPATVAASAVSGKITDPREFL